MFSNKILYNGINKIVNLFFKIVKFFIKLFTILLPLQERETLPAISSDLLYISAKQLAIKIKRKEIKCSDVIQAYIKRIKEVNPYINSIVEDRFAEAINEAREVDVMLSIAQDLESYIRDKPLLGVPLTVKESVPLEGLSNNCARSWIRSHIAEKDSECVALLRKAGAIPLLVSNTPELCLWAETSNPKCGRTKNPYDTRRTCGGSSGGEGALIGAGASLIGVGSDIAGSMRIPALFCGIFGHKPTPGFIPNDGHIPTSEDPQWDYYFTLGPMCRYVEDLPIMLQSMIPERNHIERLALNENVNLQNVKIYYMYGEGKDSLLQNEPNFQMKSALKSSVEILNTHYCCTTEKIELSYFKNSFALLLLILQLGGIRKFLRKEGETNDNWTFSRIFEFLFKKFTFQSSVSLTVAFLAPVKYVTDNLPKEMTEMLQKRLDYAKKNIIELLNTNSVLIYPTFSSEALYHRRMSGQLLDVSYCSIFNVLGLPVTHCPVRFTPEGLPVGVQIVAAPENDRLCFAVARAISAVTGGWRSPDTVKINK